MPLEAGSIRGLATPEDISGKTNPRSSFELRDYGLIPPIYHTLLVRLGSAGAVFLRRNHLTNMSAGAEVSELTSAVDLAGKLT